MLTVAQEGHMYWLEDTPESRRASFDTGKLNHPVLILGAERAGKVQALVVVQPPPPPFTPLPNQSLTPSQITSLGSTNLSNKFSDPTDRRRKKYLPLKVAGAAPHPDNGILLSVISGQPPMLTKPSYVNLEPFDVEVRFLNLGGRSTCLLPSDMLEQLMGKLLELYPNFVRHRTPSSSSQSRRPQPPAPQSRLPPAPPPPTTRRQSLPTVAQHQPSPFVARPPPPTQHSALLSSQRTHSDPYGTTPWRPDYSQDLEWNAPRQPVYRTHHHEPEEEPNYFEVTGWGILGYLGVAAGLFISMRYLFR